MPDRSITNLIITARHFYGIARENISKNSFYGNITASNLLQDSIEAMTYAVAMNLKISIDFKFESILSAVDKAMLPNSLPYRSYLSRINKMRVNSKHYGIIPDRRELEDSEVITRNFLQEVCQVVFELDFWSISITDSISDENVRNCLVNASDFLKSGDVYRSLVEVGKFLYFSFYSKFDVDMHVLLDENGYFLGFSDDFFGKIEDIPNFIFAHGPNEVFEYICINEERLNYLIDSSNVDRASFIRVSSAAPFVKLDRKTKKWAVRWPVSYMHEQDVSRIAKDLLSEAMEIATTMAESKKINAPSSAISIATVKNKSASVYEAASKNSRYVRSIGSSGFPGGSGIYVFIDYSVPNLEEEKTYWRIVRPPSSSQYYQTGYVCEDDIEISFAAPPNIYD